MSTETEAAEHIIAQEIPWSPYAEAAYLLSRWSCSCGWEGQSFRDTRANADERDSLRVAADEHIAEPLNPARRLPLPVQTEGDAEWKARQELAERARMSANDLDNRDMAVLTRWSDGSSFGSTEIRKLARAYFDHLAPGAYTPPSKRAPVVPVQTPPEDQFDKSLDGSKPFPPEWAASGGLDV